MVLRKMSINNGHTPLPSSHHLPRQMGEKMAPKQSPLPQTSFENPILLSSPSSSEDEEEEDGDKEERDAANNSLACVHSSTSSLGDSIRSER